MDSDKDSNKTDLLLSLGPVQTPSCNDDSLAESISRINFQRADVGGFRTLTEESLKEEISGKKTKFDNNVESDSDSIEEEEEESDEPDRVKELSNAGLELLGQIESAHQAAMFALDFVSLSLTKDLPAQATSTVSPELQKLVGISTLGIDKLNTSRITESQQLEEKKVVMGLQAQSLSKTVDSIFASVKGLEEEIELETKYWERILDISNKGWAICRLPSEKQTLGVRIGFSESSQAFQSRSLAALRRNSDGSVSLDQGIAKSEPQAIRVRIQSDGIETGSTAIPQLTPDNAAVEEFILQARSTIFAEELWQELQREARTLLAFGVSSTVNKITFILTPSKSAVIDLVSLFPNHSLSSPKLDDHLAEFIHLALQLNLRWVHRQARRRRAQPQPVLKPNSIPEPYSLIRPLLTRLAHERTITNLTQTLQPLIIVLRKASITASFTINRTSLPPSVSLTKAEQVLTSLTAYLESVAIVKILPGTEFTLVTRTSTSRDMVPAFQIQLNKDSPLNTLCPPPSIFHRFSDVREWIFWYTSCALTSYLLGTLPNKRPEWRLSVNPNLLKREASGPTKASRLISITTSHIQDTSNGMNGVRIRVSWEKIVGLKQETNILSVPLIKTVEAIEEKQEWKGIDKYDWFAWCEKETSESTNIDGERHEETQPIPQKSLLEIINPIWSFQENDKNILT
ncbi:Mediator of RNA polymerase II transcription subunit 17 [Golovinomyces cichoracearum]|uniref:Mediator of RNA polymerase II transcription subunit 17 n=1 Tax=Golovinomyces cichoracearum TaxID=62708 RepID=A0A420I911_9PEZI|nr:Mediator of RNA polymerase II transcription subunit 17 [Golovinomyces cichoracearum]